MRSSPGKLRFALLLVAILAGGAARAEPLGDARRAIEARDYGRAAALLAPLAARDVAEAQVELGLLHFHGWGVREDDAIAFQWFSRAAALGSADGMYHLANLYVFGLGVPKGEPDPDQRAAQFYFEAARRGHAAAQHSLGILYLTGKGVQQDAAEAQKWFRRAAAQGHAEARGFLDEPEMKR